MRFANSLYPSANFKAEPDCLIGWQAVTGDQRLLIGSAEMAGIGTKRTSSKAAGNVCSRGHGGHGQRSLMEIRLLHGGPAPRCFPLDSAGETSVSVVAEALDLGACMLPAG